jgi:outer membrane receptor protein involved in Fe transport
MRVYPGIPALICLIGFPVLAADLELAEEDEFMDEFAFLEDAGTVELAARHRQEIGMSPSAITVITREDIETSGANTLPDLLRIVPGMEVIYLGINAGTPACRLHYTEGNFHFLVLIDGREANIELMGQTLWEALPISLEDVERIEIIRGPASALYGANALSGVISITTRAISEKTSGWAMVTTGELGLTRLGLRASTRMGGWGFSLGGGLDLLGTFTDPHAASTKMWKFRALAEHRWSESARLLIDGAASSGTGPRNTNMGDLDTEFNQVALRLAHESERLRGRLYWFYVSLNVQMEAALEFGGLHLADILPAMIENHTVDGELQWTLPEFWDPLLLIVGGGGRFSWVGSDDLLNGNTFTDIGSPDYHQTGISHWEMRASAFLHAELQAAEWATFTAGARLDYNTETGWFLSPRLAVVLRPAGGQFVRFSAARSFRKPSYLEAAVHLDVSFPDDSPISAGDRDLFREFMSRVIGNEGIGNEELSSFEAGYLGRFLDDRLSVTLDLYCNLYRNRNDLVASILPGVQGLPDLRNSTYRYEETRNDLDVIGSELAVRFQPVESVSLLAIWTHKEFYYHRTESWGVQDPRNYLTLGGRFRTQMGLLGSLYVFTRSEYIDRSVASPAGLLEPPLEMHVDEGMLLLGKLGWSWSPRQDVQLEGGVKIFQPISPFDSPHFRDRDQGGGVTPDGRYYGAFLLGRIVSAYLQGSF